MVGRPYGAIASRSARNGISAVSGGTRGGPLARWRNPARLSPVDVLRGGEPAGAQSGGTPRLISLAIMWPPCSAAIPLNDSSYLYAMGKVQTAVQIPVQIALRASPQATPGTTLQISHTLPMSR